MTPERALQIFRNEIYASGAEKAEANRVIEEALGKQIEYQDLEEQGRLIKLPCKVGDTYTGICQEMVPSKKGWKTQRWIENGIIEEIHIIARLSTEKAGYVHSRDADELGEYWFIGETQKEEAEAKLKELRESEQKC